MPEQQFFDSQLPSPMRERDFQRQQLAQQTPQYPMNPFSQEQYRGLPMPDVPITYGGGVTEALISDSDVPKKWKEEHWWVFNKDVILTFLDDERKNSKLLNFDIIKIDFLSRIPYYKYTFDMEMQWGVLRNAYEMKLDRARGIDKTNVQNERKMLVSQFSELRQTSDVEAGVAKDGFFKRLLGRRG